MELGIKEGIVHNGVIIPDDARDLVDGTRVQFMPIVENATPAFGERYAKFKGAVAGLPDDLASQHEHYRLGTSPR